MTAALLLAQARAEEAAAKARRETLERELAGVEQAAEVAPVVAQPVKRKPVRRPCRVLPPEPSELSGVTSLDARRLEEMALRRGMTKP